VIILIFRMVCFRAQPAKKSAIKLHYLKKGGERERQTWLSQVFSSLLRRKKEVCAGEREKKSALHGLLSFGNKFCLLNKIFERKNTLRHPHLFRINHSDHSFSGFKTGTSSLKLEANFSFKSLYPEKIASILL
jgi:hypothetical protein